MTFIHEPEQTGFLVRVYRIYCEKRRQGAATRVTREGPTTQIYFSRLPRRDAFLIAWRQARAARGM